MKKKLIAVIMSAICIFAFSACGTDATRENNGTTNNATTDEVTLDDNIRDDAEDIGDNMSQRAKNVMDDLNADSERMRARAQQ